MTTGCSVPLTDSDLVAIGGAWEQSEEGKHIFSEIPRVIGSSIEDGFTGITTYDLVDLAWATNAGGGNYAWRPGMAIPAGESIQTAEVTFRQKIERAEVLDRNLLSTRSRYADLNNPLKSRLSQLMTGITYRLFSYLTNTGVFGAAKTFSGAALDTADYSNQKPITDIEANLKALRDYQDGDRFQLWAILDRGSYDVLRGRPEYTGAGEGSNSSGMLPFDAFKERFAATHGLDKVLISRTTYNTAAQGATKARGLGTPVIWFGIVDTRANGLDLSGGNSNDLTTNPDGALVMSSGRNLATVRSQVYGDLGIERFNPTCEFSFFSPRGSEMACFYTGADIRS